MRIIITIAHPAHVHYFKNAARILEGRGHKILFFIRDRECIVELVKDLGFDYVCYGKGGDGMLSKLFQIPIIDYKLLRVALRFKPDIFLSSASPIAAHVSKLIGKPHIALSDTDHATLFKILYRPFTDVIFSPYVYRSKIHRKQILLQYFQEYFYLNSKYYNPDVDILTELNCSLAEKYCVIRFVSWNAWHDAGVAGLSYQDKITIIERISAKCKVFISSESQLPPELEQYRLPTPSSKFHDVVHFSTLCISEGSTTASEAAIMGIPTIYTNPLRLGYCDEEEKYGLLHQSCSVDDIIKKSVEIIETADVKDIYSKRRDKLTSKMIDANTFMVWFIENYPKSKITMITDSDYQYRFK